MKRLIFLVLSLLVPSVGAGAGTADRSVSETKGSDDDWVRTAAPEKREKRKTRGEKRRGST